MLRVASACSLLVAFAAVSLGLPQAPQKAKEGADRPSAEQVPATSAPPQIRVTHPIIQFAKRLNERVDFIGIDDDKTTLEDALELFRALYGLPFDVRGSAFKAEGFDDVQSFRIAAGKPIRPMKGVKLVTALNRVLSRLECHSGATFVIRDDLLEVTTGAFKRSEFYVGPTFEEMEMGQTMPGGVGAAGGAFGVQGGLGALGGGMGALGGGIGALGGGIGGGLGLGGGFGGGLGAQGGLGMLGGGLGGPGAPGGRAGGPPLPAPEDGGPGMPTFKSKRTLLPLVQVEFDKRPLEEALKELAASAQLNVVLSANVGEKGKAPVTATLLNVPADTAVQILADMAELKPVFIDKVLYVTTRESASRLQREMDRRGALPDSTEVGPASSNPPPGGGM